MLNNPFTQSILSYFKELKDHEFECLKGILRTQSDTHISRYNNPRSVAVAIIPLDNGNLLGIRRGTQPNIGGLCFPGGYQEELEDPTLSAVREVYEETGLELDFKKFQIFGNPLVNHLNIQLLFFLYDDALPASIINDLIPTDEALSYEEITSDTPLCFPFHEIKRKFFFAEK